jgi:predicted nucleotidyltransferase
MLTKKNAIETAGLFIADLKTLGYNPTQAWLFGSVVSEKIHAYSDIDLALWDNKFTGVLHLDGEKIKRLLLKYKLIELHSFPASLTENEDPFIGEIKKTGERIL